MYNSNKFCSHQLGAERRAAAAQVPGRLPAPHPQLRAPLQAGAGLLQTGHAAGGA